MEKVLKLARALQIKKSNSELLEKLKLSHYTE